MLHLKNAVRSRRVNTMIAAVILSVVAVLGLDAATAPGAYASGSNWAEWSGDCYGWTIWNANQVTGYVWDHSSDECEIWILQSDSAYPNNNAVSDGWATAPQTGARTATYWHGRASDGGILTDQVCVLDWYKGTHPICSPLYN